MKQREKTTVQVRTVKCEYKNYSCRLNREWDL